MEWKEIIYKSGDLINPGEFVNIDDYSEDILVKSVQSYSNECFCVARVEITHKCPCIECVAPVCGDCNGNSVKSEFQIVPSGNVRALDRHMELVFRNRPTHYCKIEEN